MSDFFLSIIVPVFKVEPYVDKCAGSLFQTLLPEVEYVFIDDCTPDQSMARIQAQAQKHQVPERQIKFLRNEKNEGLSVTRNHGASAASGKYIWFVDSDDWIADGVLPKLLSCLKQEQPEILALNVIRTNCAQQTVEFTAYLKNYAGVFEGKKLLERALPCAPFYVIRNSFWRENHFSFYPGIYHEDTELIPKVMYLAKRIVVFCEIAYYYRTARESIVTVPKLKRSMDLLFVVKRLTNFMEKNVAAQDRFLFADIISIALTSSVNNAVRLKREEQIAYTDALTRDRGLFSVCRESSRLKHRGLSLFQTVPVFFFLFFYRVLCKIRKCK